MSILTYVFVWVFVMYMFVRITIHILMGFRHVHVCIAGFTFLKLIVAHVAAVQRWKKIIKLSFPTPTTDRHSWYSTHDILLTKRTKTQHQRQCPKAPDLTIIPFKVAVLDITEPFRIS